MGKKRNEFYAAGHVVGYTVAMPSSNTLSRVVGRDPYRPGLATNCATFVGQACVDAHRYAYDALSRPVWRVSEGAGASPVDSAFEYNDRSEVVSAAIGTNRFVHGYDGIGNHTLHAANALTNAFAANCLNQYTGITPASAPVRELRYNLDGNLVDDGSWYFAYDAGNRLVSVTSAEWTNGAIRVLNTYDYLDRRIGKTVQRLTVTVAGPPAPPVTYLWETLETREYLYDGWNLVHETVRRPGVPDEEIQYVWGLDLSGTLQGAGGVGGLVAVSRGGQYYFTAYDNNGNVTRYIDETGATVAAYGYDDFGNTISASGPMADIFRHRFSTKYYDHETGLYYYGYRFYSPALMRWMNRDPIEEEGGENLYAFCGNGVPYRVDSLGNAYICDCLRNVALRWSKRRFRLDVERSYQDSIIMGAWRRCYDRVAPKSVLHGVETAFARLGVRDVRASIGSDIKANVSDNILCQLRKARYNPSTVTTVSAGSAMRVLLSGPWELKIYLSGNNHYQAAVGYRTESPEHIGDALVFFASEIGFVHGRPNSYNAERYVGKVYIDDEAQRAINQYSPVFQEPVF